MGELLAGPFTMLEDSCQSAEMRIDIGCGDSPRAEYLGLDVRPTCGVGVLADASRLPFRDGSFIQVFSSHSLEHFGHRKVRSVLEEWVRILRPGGIFEVRCPDLRARALLFVLHPNWKNVVDIYGGQDDEFDFHKSGFSYGLLKGLMEDLGIEEVNRIVAGHKGVPFLPNSLHLKGKKRP